MTGARWTSLIFGCLCLGSLSVKMEDANFWDFLLSICALLVPASLIIMPLVLEFMERKRKKEEKDG